MEMVKGTAKIDIEHSAAEAVRIINQAAEVAATRLASAANDATKVVASAASEAVKVSAVRVNDDHDLLIRIEEQMRGLKADILDLKEGTSTKIADHEHRIACLEIARGEIKGESGGMRDMWGWVAAAILLTISIATVVISILKGIK
jgi:hypothetical protein